MSFATLTYAAAAITVLITGYYAFIFLRDPKAAMQTATHRAEMLPRVMAGRYVVVFLLALGVLIFNDIAVAAYFFAVCAFLGFHDGFVYWRAGLPHFKHTLTGLLSFGAMGIALVAQLKNGVV